MSAPPATASPQPTVLAQRGRRETLFSDIAEAADALRIVLDKQLR